MWYIGRVVRKLIYVLAVSSGCRQGLQMHARLPQRYLEDLHRWGLQSEEPFLVRGLRLDSTCRFLMWTAKATQELTYSQMHSVCWHTSLMIARKIAGLTRTRPVAVSRK